MTAVFANKTDTCLSAEEAARFDRGDVLRWTGAAGALRDDPWTPWEARANTRRYVVDGGDTTLQTVIDRIVDAGAGDVTVTLVRGNHMGPAIVPPLPDGLRLTIEGGGASPADTRLIAPIDAEMTGREYGDRFAATFAKSGPAVRAMYQDIIARPTISTGNTAVLRICGNGVRVRNLIVRNSYNADRGPIAPDAVVNADGQVSRGQHQAVALMVDGADRVELDALHLISFQDTLYLKSPARDATARTAIRNSMIEGDVDFIFGQATAHFSGCAIRSRGTRGARSWVVAPATNLRVPYGFVFDDCTFTHDGSDLARAGRFRLGRQWFEGVRATPYGDLPYRCDLTDENRLSDAGGQVSRDTIHAVGKTVILNSRIGGHIDAKSPWDAWNGPVDTWNPRYRPVQARASDFLRHMAAWGGVDAADYADIDPDAIFLGLYNNSFDGGV